MLAPLLATEADLEARANVEGQAGIADGPDVLLAEQVVELGKDGDLPGGGVSEAEIELAKPKSRLRFGSRRAEARKVESSDFPLMAPLKLR